MKAFVVGLLFLVAVIILYGAGLLLFPLLMVLAFMARILIAVFLIIFAIWLLGKFILYVWKTMQ